MTLIWKNLLHANFRCGRMYTTPGRIWDRALCIALCRPNVCANVMAKLPKR